jgi:hypothetical protein
VKTTVFTAIVFASTLAAWSVAAQPLPFNEAGVTNGHWHLNSKDVAVNEKIFVGMGGKAFQAGGRHRMMFPGVMIILDGAPGTPPPNGPTQGSVFNHVGFVVNNVQEQVAKWKAAGVPVEPGNNGRLDQAYVNRRGIRIGSVKDGKVVYFIPPPVPPDPKMQPPIGIVVDGNGAIYAASDDQKDIKKYVKN